jgi:DNA-binding XRE family transcriptional regulator
VKDIKLKYVYIISNGLGANKVGISKNPSNRLASLQTSSPSRLTLVYHKEVPAGMALLAEKIIHKKLEKYNIGFEWFSAEIQTIILVIENVVVDLPYSGCVDGPNAQITDDPSIKVPEHFHVLCRVARAGLGWSLGDLASKAGVHKNTVQRIESGRFAQKPTLRALYRVLEDAGAVFFDSPDAPAVGIRVAPAPKSESAQSSE